ncbi:MAG: SxtJ family membrane protein [Candidatus Omnitrophica bacterium]|nr:SxtJ family membrane protein [Candidatus Omnitrophota bacterium]
MEKIILDTKNLKKFGMTMGIAFLVIAIFIIIRHKHSPLPVLIIALIFFIMGVVTPALLKPAYIAWMRFAYLLGWINTRLILVIIFYLVLTPIGLVMRLCGIDSLERKINKKAGSYWKKRELTKPSYERQF